MSEAPGFYGKLPNLGDFVVRRLPPSFVERWDSWLQDGIAASRERLAEHWDLYYSEAPPWRFVLSPGVCGERSWYGVVVPSVDRVGRFFPLAVAACADRLSNLPDALLVNDWFGPVEAALAEVLAGNMGLDELDGHLQTLGGIESHLPSVAHSTTVMGGAWEQGVVVEGARSPATAFAVFARQALESRLGAYSLWTTAGGRYAPAATLAAQSFPSASQYIALLCGRWSDYGWTPIAQAREPEPGAMSAPSLATGVEGGRDAELARAADPVSPGTELDAIPEDYESDLLADPGSLDDFDAEATQTFDQVPGRPTISPARPAAAEDVGTNPALEAIPEDFETELAELVGAGEAPLDDDATRTQHREGGAQSQANLQIGSAPEGSATPGELSIDDLLADPAEDSEKELSILDILESGPSEMPPELRRKTEK